MSEKTFRDYFHMTLTKSGDTPIRIWEHCGNPHILILPDVSGQWKVYWRKGNPCFPSFRSGTTTHDSLDEAKASALALLD